MGRASYKEHAWWFCRARTHLERRLELRTGTGLREDWIRIQDFQDPLFEHFGNQADDPARSGVHAPATRVYYYISHGNILVMAPRSGVHAPATRVYYYISYGNILVMAPRSGVHAPATHIVKRAVLETRRLQKERRRGETRCEKVIEGARGSTSGPRRRRMLWTASRSGGIYRRAVFIGTRYLQARGIYRRAVFVGARYL